MGHNWPWATDCANWSFYPGLKVPVHAPRNYIRKDDKKDEYSHKLILCKGEDMSDFFMPKLIEIFERRFTKMNLIIVVPSSEVGKYSPTLLAIGQKLSEKYSIKNENIIKRSKAVKKGKFTPTLEERFKNVRGTMALSRHLTKDERNIMLIDDTKTSGIHLLECAKLLTEDSAPVRLNIAALCLGINKLGGSE